MYMNQLNGNIGGSLLGGQYPEPPGVICGNQVQLDEEDEENPLTRECPEYVRTNTMQRE